MRLKWLTSVTKTYNRLDSILYNEPLWLCFNLLFPCFFLFLRLLFCLTVTIARFRRCFSLQKFFCIESLFVGRIPDHILKVGYEGVFLFDKWFINLDFAALDYLGAFLALVAFLFALLQHFSTNFAKLFDYLVLHVQKWIFHFVLVVLWNHIS